MKKIALAVSAALLLAGSAIAGDMRDNVGCGLGTSILGKSENSDSLLMQVLAATTNGTFGNQTFGITSGTLGCDRAEKIVNNDKLHKFVVDNMDELAMDISAGHGEALVAVADMLEIPAEKRASFYAKLKADFNKIYASNDVEAADVINIMAENI
jgi:hypothetical protein